MKTKIAERLTTLKKELSDGEELKENLNDFVKDHDLAELYRKYSWKNDTWNKGEIKLLFNTHGKCIFNG